MKQQELLKKIGDLEKRIKELESNPKIQFVPYPVIVPQIGQPWYPWVQPIWYITSGCKSNVSSSITGNYTNTNT